MEGARTRKGDVELLMCRVPRDRARGERAEEGSSGYCQQLRAALGELGHSGRDSLGRDACAMLRSPAPGEQPRCDCLGLTVRSCKAFPGGSQARPAGSHAPLTLKGPLACWHSTPSSLSEWAEGIGSRAPCGCKNYGMLKPLTQNSLLVTFTHPPVHFNHLQINYST